MKLEVDGYFKFKINSTGCLSGHYINEGEKIEFPEAAKSKSKINDGFEGTYIAVWIEQNGNPHSATLSITSAGFGFDLIWKKGTRVLFEGKGVILDGELVGSYRIVP